MPSAVIRGVACSGMGHVSRLAPEILEARSKATGVELVPGTFNVLVADLRDAVARLGPPDFELPGPARLGPLCFWRAVLSVGLCSWGCYVVRHVRSRTDYLELVSSVHFRSEGVEDGTTVELWHA